jgi:hypothetical protein
LCEDKPILRTVVDYLADHAELIFHFFNSKLIGNIIKLKVNVDEESFSILSLRAQAKSSLQHNHSVLSSDQLSSDHQQTALHLFCLQLLRLKYLSTPRRLLHLLWCLLCWHYLLVVCWSETVLCLDGKPSCEIHMMHDIKKRKRQLEVSLALLSA